MPANPLRDSNPLQRRSDVTPQDHVGCERLRSILDHGREEVVLMGAVEGDQPPLLQFFNHERGYLPPRQIAGKSADYRPRKERRPSLGTTVTRIRFTGHRSCWLGTFSSPDLLRIASDEVSGPQPVGFRPSDVARNPH